MICRICKIDKPLTDFYPNYRYTSGHMYLCKLCDNKIRRENYIKNIFRERARVKRYLRTEAGKKSAHEVWRRGYEKYPEKFTARTETTKAIKKGTLTKTPCEVCGETKVQAHHDDYSKPLEVTWLCGKHHRQLHGMQLPDSDIYQTFEISSVKIS